MKAPVGRRPWRRRARLEARPGRDLYDGPLPHWWIYDGTKEEELALRRGMALLRPFISKAQFKSLTKGDDGTIVLWKISSPLRSIYWLIGINGSQFFFRDGVYSSVCVLSTDTCPPDALLAKVLMARTDPLRMASAPMGYGAGAYSSLESYGFRIIP